MAKVARRPSRKRHAGRLVHMRPGTVQTLWIGLSLCALTAACSVPPPHTPAEYSETTIEDAPLIFPDESSTGVPDGTLLQPTGSVRLDEYGAVLEGMHVTGSITVAADDVVIRRTLIDNTGLYAIRVMEGSTGLVVEDSEINGNATGSAVVCCSDFELRRVDIHDAFEGPRANGNVVIADSYVHHMLRCPDCHIDTVQTTGGSDVTITGNNLQAYNPETGDLANAAFQFGTTQGGVSGLLVENNLLNGGAYTVNGGGGGSIDSGAVFRGNRFGRDFRYGPVANLGPMVHFDESNVWHDTGEPVLG